MRCTVVAKKKTLYYYQVDKYFKTKIILCSETNGKRSVFEIISNIKRRKVLSKTILNTRNKKPPEALPPLRPLMAPRDAVGEITARKDKAVTCCYNACHIKSPVV